MHLEYIHMFYCRKDKQTKEKVRIAAEGGWMKEGRAVAPGEIGGEGGELQGVSGRRGFSIVARREVPCLGGN
jgi:hypothetical protein